MARRAIVDLRSTVNGSAWNLHAPATQTVDTLMRKTARRRWHAPVTATHSVNSGNNNELGLHAGVDCLRRSNFTGAAGVIRTGWTSDLDRLTRRDDSDSVNSVATGGTVIVAAGAMPGAT
jgi:hypothetical protein